MGYYEADLPLQSRWATIQKVGIIAAYDIKWESSWITITTLPN